MLRSISVTIALVLVLASVLAGCTPVPEDAETEEATVDSEAAPVVVEPSEPVGSTDFTYLPGTWSVSATLDEIDKGAMREAADQPSQRWEIALDGTVMTLVTDTHTYVGTIEPELDSGWVFTAVTTENDEDGEVWTSAIEVHGKRTGDSTFAGSMEATVVSGGAHQYKARWTLEGRRP